jgi:S-adenosyl-L-methionine hydrolase (adenosine-forming)
MAIITLTTDFGITDAYVGAMKGVILSIAPGVRIVDITHAVDAQDRMAAAWILDDVLPYFPIHTVHVVVVDPGVGTSRRIVCADFAGRRVICPDNGILSVVLARKAPEAIFAVENAALFCRQVSRTFHGRDIFAPVAAHLARGRSIRDVGPAVDVQDLERLPMTAPVAADADTLTGEVVYRDRFGNLVTNIHETRIRRHFETTEMWIHAGPWTIDGLAESYADVSDGAPLALIGSRGYLEIAVNAGNAAERSGLGGGAAVILHRRTVR